MSIVKEHITESVGCSSYWVGWYRPGPLSLEAEWRQANTKNQLPTQVPTPKYSTSTVESWSLFSIQSPCSEEALRLRVDTEAKDKDKKEEDTKQAAADQRVRDVEEIRLLMAAARLEKEEKAFMNRGGPDIPLKPLNYDESIAYVTGRIEGWNKTVFKDKPKTIPDIKRLEAAVVVDEKLQPLWREIIVRKVFACWHVIPSDFRKISEHIDEGIAEFCIRSSGDKIHKPAS